MTGMEKWWEYREARASVIWPTRCVDFGTCEISLRDNEKRSKQTVEHQLRTVKVPVARLAVSDWYAPGRICVFPRGVQSIVGLRTFDASPLRNPPVTMPLSSKLDRKLHAVEESSDDEEYYEVTDRSSSASVMEFGDAEEIPSSEEEADGSEDDRSEDDDMVSLFGSAAS